MKDRTILAALERLGAAFPWDKVSIHIDRNPDGEFKWWVVIHDNPTFGFRFECNASNHVHNDIEALVAYAILHWSDGRDPEKARDNKIKELKEQVDKLQSVVLGLPPFRPNRELAMNNQPHVMDV